MVRGTVEISLSNRIRSEYEETLTSDKLRVKYPRLTLQRIWQVLDHIDALAVRLPNPPHRIRYRRDPKDEPFVNLAIHIQARYLVTRDRDLLDLADDANLSLLARELRIVTPMGFLDDVTAVVE